MKISNEIKIFIGILLVSLSVPILAAAQAAPNDYIAFVWDVSNFNASKGNELLDIEYPVGYIPIVTGSPTYTYTRAYLTTEINMTQPNQINGKIKDTIMAFAVSKGYNIKRIVFQGYNVVKP